MLQEMDRNGYFVFVENKKGETAKRYVDELVCEAFHGPRPSPEHEVRHRDGNITNNRASNLMWVLPQA